mmetsp:Transcript_40760/g.73236  ORF Transcript_40760/g.73236 Transcript_40760/m.73236 type:complete len:236 (-) Transcript_40760:320-1027(-)
MFMLKWAANRGSVLHLSINCSVSLADSTSFSSGLVGTRRGRSPGGGRGKRSERGSPGRSPPGGAVNGLEGRPFQSVGGPRIGRFTIKARRLGSLSRRIFHGSGGNSRYGSGRSASRTIGVGLPAASPGSMLPPVGCRLSGPIDLRLGILIRRLFPRGASRAEALPREGDRLSRELRLLGDDPPSRPTPSSSGSLSSDELLSTGLGLGRTPMVWTYAASSCFATNPRSFRLSASLS